MLPLAPRNARFEEAARIAGALIDGDDRIWLELRSQFIHTELQRLPDMPADIEPERSKVDGCRDSFKMPPHKESFVRSEVLSKIVQRGFQLGRPVGEQDHLGFFRESN